MSNNENVPAETPTPLFTGKTYDRLKALVQVVLPAFATLYLALASTWGLPASGQVAASATAVAAFFGVLLGISSKRYNANSETEKVNGTMLVSTNDDGGTLVTMVLNEEPEQTIALDRVVFKVVRERLVE